MRGLRAAFMLKSLAYLRNRFGNKVYFLFEPETGDNIGYFRLNMHNTIDETFIDYSIVNTAYDLFKKNKIASFQYLEKEVEKKISEV